ncbi:MAG: DmsC/YnfH family molybdoenzyme membrane anchor subunit [Verrucomicrobiales bacterium]
MLRHERAANFRGTAGRLLHEVSLIDTLLAEQAALTAVDRFSAWHEAGAGIHSRRSYHELVPLQLPGAGEQFSFEVNLDQCTACKACVAACHSLNGLDDDESWRDVGYLVAEDAPYRQSVPTTCHHCVEPACLHGCPVLAYEKSPVTGIVRHLDDQCIGCSYCILKCPYDVPKYNRKRGIVRKCDMCSQRLGAGEAPACVQACPNEAIGIRVVRTAAVAANSKQPNARLLPYAVPSRYTQPSTRFITAKTMPAGARSADADNPPLEPAHLPLVAMLLLTQSAAGLFLFSNDGPLLWLGFGLLMAGLAASVLHLGQPLKAWRSFLGWRRSWLSREIIAFGVWAPAGFAAAMGWIPSLVAAVVGLTAVFCSVMVYVDTRRPFWAWPSTATKFFGTVLVLGAATEAISSPSLAGPAGLLVLTKLGLENAALHRANPQMARTLLLLSGRAGIAARLRNLLALAGVGLVFLSPTAALLLWMAGEVLERLVFFRAAAAWRMPGAA